MIITSSTLSLLLECKGLISGDGYEPAGYVTTDL
jgi:hypothetical protein